MSAKLANPFHPSDKLEALRQVRAAIGASALPHITKLWFSFALGVCEQDGASLDEQLGLRPQAGKRKLRTIARQRERDGWIRFLEIHLFDVPDSQRPARIVEVLGNPNVAPNRLAREAALVLRDFGRLPLSCRHITRIIAAGKLDTS